MNCFFNNKETENCYFFHNYYNTVEGLVVPSSFYNQKRREQQQQRQIKTKVFSSVSTTRRDNVYPPLYSSSSSSSIYAMKSANQDDDNDTDNDDDKIICIIGSGRKDKTKNSDITATTTTTTNTSCEIVMNTNKNKKKENDTYEMNRRETIFGVATSIFALAMTFQGGTAMASGRGSMTLNNNNNNANVLSNDYTTSISEIMEEIKEMDELALSSSSSSMSSSYVTVPLDYTGSELLIYYRIDGSLFRAALDTGSPFLMIPGTCYDWTKSKSGCYRKQGIPSGYETSYEQFDGFGGDVEWRMGPFSFVNTTAGSLSLRGEEIIQGGPKSIPPFFTFGVASESIMKGPGGIFLGMIRDTDDWIRPSFLGQTSVQSFEIDLKNQPNTLTLSTMPRLKPINDYIHLTKDLRRRYGDPVQHYTAKAKSVSVNGKLLKSATSTIPIYVIFDTGVTGMVVSRDLFNERYIIARKGKEKKLWGNVTITFGTKQKQSIDIYAMNPLTTPFDPKNNWGKKTKSFSGHIIVMGLSFLNGNKLTVDIDQQKLWLES